MNRTDPMAYLPDMEVLHDSDITEEVLAQRKEYDSLRYTAADVRSALAKENRSLQNFAALLSPAAIPLLEEITTQAKAETRKHFGNSICIFTPLYLANYCENGCVYCGFNRSHTIRRAQLTPAEMEREMRSISGTGLEEILLLTGESKTKSDLHYIGEACTMAHRYFKMTGLEVYPMNTQEYASLQACGADFVTVFQETYDIERYEVLHPSGRKRVFPYRLNAQERALRGGMRGVGFGALLGLADFRKDAFATGVHAWLLQRNYPHAEFSFSCPRLRPITTGEVHYGAALQEADLLQVICAYRLLMPYAGITISTRESAHFRNHVSAIATTKISAGVSTSIGGHQESQKEKGDGQFEIADTRSVHEIYSAMKEYGLQPVMNDSIYL